MNPAKVFLTIALLLILTGCQQLEPDAERDTDGLCHCSVDSVKWYGTVMNQCGAAGGSVLVFRLDDDITKPLLSRKYVLSLSASSDSLQLNYTYSKTIYVDGHATDLDIRILSVDGDSANAEFDMLNMVRDSSVSGTIRLYRDPNVPTGCI